MSAVAPLKCIQIKFGTVGKNGRFPFILRRPDYFSVAVPARAGIQTLLAVAKGIKSAQLFAAAVINVFKQSNKHTITQRAI